MGSKPIKLQDENMLELGFRKLKNKLTKEAEIVNLEQFTEGMYECKIGDKIMIVKMFEVSKCRMKRKTNGAKSKVSENFFGKSKCLIKV